MISPGTLIGILSGFGLFGWAVFSATDNYLMFFDYSGILMVVGGTLASTLISYRFIYVWRAFASFFRIFLYSGSGWKDLNDNMRRLLRWGREVQDKGLGVLDDHLTSDEKLNSFMQYGLECVASGYKGEELYDLLNDYNENLFVRENVQVGILQTMGAFAPAFGMIGTLVGLIIMLDGMGSDPTQLGKGLALALLTTLYGVLLANLIFKPAALKIRQGNEIVHYENSILTASYCLLAKRAEPLVIQDKINSFLDIRRRLDALKEEE